MAVMVQINEDKIAHRALVEQMIADMMISYGDQEELQFYSDLMASSRVVVEFYFGKDALELTAQFCTNRHMTSDEIIVWAATEWDQAKRVMRGEEEV